VSQKIMYYKALGNKIRLQAFHIISKQQPISFNDISNKINIERGLLAYHLGVLKAAGLITVEYKRSGKEISKYSLTREGEKFLQGLTKEDEETLQEEPDKVMMGEQIGGGLTPSDVPANSLTSTISSAATSARRRRPSRHP